MKQIMPIFLSSMLALSLSSCDNSPAVDPADYPIVTEKLLDNGDEFFKIQYADGTWQIRIKHPNGLTTQEYSDNWVKTRRSEKLLDNGDHYIRYDYPDGTWKETIFHTNFTTTYNFSENFKGRRYGNEKSF